MEREQCSRGRYFVGLLEGCEFLGEEREQEANGEAYEYKKYIYGTKKKTH